MKAYSGTQDMGDSPRLKAGRSIELGSEASVTAICCIRPRRLKPPTCLALTIPINDPTPAAATTVPKAPPPPRRNSASTARRHKGCPHGEVGTEYDQQEGANHGVAQNVVQSFDQLGPPVAQPSVFLRRVAGPDLSWLCTSRQHAEQHRCDQEQKGGGASAGPQDRGARARTLPTRSGASETTMTSYSSEPDTPR
jgi:hypothetical protein